MDRLFVGLTVIFGFIALALTVAPCGGLNVIFFIGCVGFAVALASHRLGRRHP